MTCPRCGTIAAEGQGCCARCRASLAPPERHPEVPVPVLRAPTARGRAAQKAAGVTPQVLAKKAPQESSSPGTMPVPSQPPRAQPTGGRPSGQRGTGHGAGVVPARSPAPHPAAPAGPTPATPPGRPPVGRPVAREAEPGWAPPPGWALPPGWGPPPPGWSGPSEPAGGGRSAPAGGWAPPDPSQLRPGPPPDGPRRWAAPGAAPGAISRFRAWRAGGSTVASRPTVPRPTVPPSTVPPPTVAGTGAPRSSGQAGSGPTPSVQGAPVVAGTLPGSYEAGAGTAPSSAGAADRQRAATSPGTPGSLAGASPWSGLDTEPIVFAVPPPPPPDALFAGDGPSCDDTLVVDGTAPLPLALVGDGQGAKSVPDGDLVGSPPPAPGGRAPSGSEGASPGVAAPWPPPPGPWSGQRAGGG